MNLTGETQPLVEQLMMIKRMQVNISFTRNTILNVPECVLPQYKIHHSFQEHFPNKPIYFVQLRIEPFVIHA